MEEKGKRRHRTQIGEGKETEKRYVKEGRENMRIGEGGMRKRV